MSTPFAEEFKAQIAFRLQENPPRIAACLALLSEEEVWRRPNEATVSVGNLLLHLCGNIRQYAISALGQWPDHRERDQEFAAKEGFSKRELLERLESTVSEAVNLLSALEPEDLEQIYSVQGFRLSGIGILVHVCEHLSYHTGQIALHTKWLKGQDLGFYAGLDLNTPNGD